MFDQLPQLTGNGIAVSNVFGSMHAVPCSGTINYSGAMYALAEFSGAYSPGDLVGNHARELRRYAAGEPEPACNVRYICVPVEPREAGVETLADAWVA